MASVLLIGGPNGAGKTTTAMDLLPRELHWRHFVNADNIAAGLSPLDPDAAAIPAGKLMLRRIHELAERGEDFAFESTLAAKSFAPFLRNCQSRGYEVHLLVWLESPELAIQRVAERVRKGGHHIPEPTIRRRYCSGLSHLFSIYLPLADAWVVCDNSGDAPKSVARWDGRSSEVEVLRPEIWQRMKEDAG